MDVFFIEAVERLDLKDSWTEILLHVLEKNGWIRTSEVYWKRMKGGMTRKRTIEVMSEMASSPFELLEKDEITSGDTVLFYRFRPNQEYSAFKKVLKVFVYKPREFRDRFANSKYFRENEKHLLRFERVIENEIAETEKETDRLISAIDNSIEDTSPYKTFFIIYHSSLDEQSIKWNNLRLFWMGMVFFCGSCGQSVECLERKVEKYGAKVKKDELKRALNKKSPADLMASYCSNQISRIEGYPDHLNVC